MDLRQIRYVDAVAASANFTRAAAQLHVAQPALSLAIRNLETELGVRLFDRTSRRVSLTDAGLAFVADAREILGKVDQLGEHMAEYAGAIRGHVRISVWYHMAPDLPGLLHSHISANPGVQFTIVELPGPVMLDALRRGELDMAYPALAPGLDFSELEHVIIREEPVTVALALDHPLAGDPAITLDQLALLSIIAPAPGTSRRIWLDDVFSRAGIRPRIVIETNELAAAVAYASLGIGAAVQTRRITEATRIPVAIVPVEATPPMITALAWSPTRYRGPAAERALAFARSILEQGSAKPPGRISDPEALPAA
jgi:DNA-binding transcriptional LysR family regulator